MRSFGYAHFPSALYSKLTTNVAFDQNQIAAYVSGEQHLIIKNYPEFKCYRDVSYYFKYFMNTETEAFPPIAEWTQKEAQTMWKLGEAGYEVFDLHFCWV